MKTLGKIVSIVGLGMLLHTSCVSTRSYNKGIIQGMPIENNTQTAKEVTKSIEIGGGARLENINSQYANWQQTKTLLDSTKKVTPINVGLTLNINNFLFSIYQEIPASSLLGNSEDVYATDRKSYTTTKTVAEIYKFPSVAIGGRFFTDKQESHIGISVGDRLLQEKYYQSVTTTLIDEYGQDLGTTAPVTTPTIKEFHHQPFIRFDVIIKDKFGLYVETGMRYDKVMGPFKNSYVEGGIIIPFEIYSRKRYVE